MSEGAPLPACRSLSADCSSLGVAEKSHEHDDFQGTAHHKVGPHRSRSCSRNLCCSALLNVAGGGRIFNMESSSAGAFVRVLQCGFSRRQISVSNESGMMSLTISEVKFRIKSALTETISFDDYLSHWTLFCSSKEL